MKWNEQKHQYRSMWDSVFKFDTFRSMVSKMLTIILPCYHVQTVPHKPLSMTGTNMQICAWSNFKEFVEAITTFFVTICTNILWFIQCPGGAFTPDIQTTKEFPDDVVTFVRNHPVMFNPIYPVGRRPLVVRTNADYKYTSVAVDQVMAADGNYQVLFLGTGMDVDRYRRQKY